MNIYGTSKNYAFKNFDATRTLMYQNTKENFSIVSGENVIDISS